MFSSLKNLRNAIIFIKPKPHQIIAALAIIAGSALLVSQIPHSAKADDTIYQQVFSDNFDRANTNGTTISNGWTFPGGYNCDNVRPNPAIGITNWKIIDNALQGGAGTCDDRANSASQYSYRSSPMLQPAHNIYNGKITFDYDTSTSSTYAMSGVLARYNPADGSGAYFGFYEAANNTMSVLYARILKPGNFGEINRSYAEIYPWTAINKVMPAHLRIELILQDNSWTYNVYDIDASLTTPFHSAQGSFTDLTALTGRTWGLQAYGAVSPYDNVTLYKTDLPLTTSAPASIIKTGESLTYTIHDDEDRTITNFSDSAGGTFSPSSIQLTAANNYVATVTYTPAQSGKHTITANVTGGETLRSEILAQPYSTQIGMLGDSITAHNYASLSNNLVKLNVAVCGGRASEFAANSITGTKCGGLAGAQNTGDPWQTITINTLVENNIDIVHLMLGSNDLWASTPPAYKTHMQTAIDALKAAGIKHVILSKLVWRHEVDAPTRITGFGTIIDELIAENNGYVLPGDTDAYAWFQNDNTANMTDGLHPNSGLGQRTLMDFWTTAITRNLKYQVAPNHAWTNDTNYHISGETGTLTHTIDKYFGDFTNVVKIDGTTLSSSDYTATAGSTIIELSNSLLNILPTGSHTLTVEFYGNVQVSSNFAIAANSQSICQNGATNFPACDDNIVIPATPNGPNAPEVPKTGTQTISASTEATATSNILIALATTAIILGTIVLAKRKTIRKIN